MNRLCGFIDLSFRPLQFADLPALHDWLCRPLRRRSTAQAVRSLQNPPEPPMRIAFELPDQPEVIALIAELDAYQATLYPPESCHSLDLASLKQPNVLFAVARDAAGAAMGCGAVVLGSEYGGRQPALK